MLSIQGKETVDDLHKKLGHIMWGKRRHGPQQGEPPGKRSSKFRRCASRSGRTSACRGTDKEFNQELEKAVRLADFLELGELMARDALNGTNPAAVTSAWSTRPRKATLRDDEHYVYVAAWEYTGKDKEPELVKEPLAFETVHLAQRNYKD